MPVSLCFSVDSFSVCLFVESYPVLSAFAVFCSSPDICFLTRDRNSVDLDEKRHMEDMGEAGGGRSHNRDTLYEKLFLIK